MPVLLLTKHKTKMKAASISKEKTTTGKISKKPTSDDSSKKQTTPTLKSKSPDGGASSKGKHTGSNGKEMNSKSVSGSNVNSKNKPDAHLNDSPDSLKNGTNTTNGNASGKENTASNKHKSKPASTSKVNPAPKENKANSIEKPMNTNRHSSSSDAMKAPRESSKRKTVLASESKNDVTYEFFSFFVGELKDIYWAEQALAEVLPEIRDKATSSKLVEALDKHLRETDVQITRLEEIFRILGEEPETKTCKAMKGLIEEAKDLLNLDDDLIRDAGIILASQKVEHYEIATYGTLIAFAKVMGRQRVVSLLEETLKEEKAADTNLTVIAESFVNHKAVTESEITEIEDMGYLSYVRKWINETF